MNCSIETTLRFEKELKKLSKKYPSVKKEYANLLDNLCENPTLGISLGQDVFKIRMAIASKGKGKSGGARVISYVQINHQTILLLTIYNKGDKDSISDKEIKILLNDYLSKK